MDFTAKLKQARKQSGLSQKAIAEHLYISQQAYAKYENGQSSPNPDVLKKIAEILDVSSDYLLSCDPAPDNVFPFTTKRIPLLGDIACGEPIFAEEAHGNYVITSDNIEADFCLRAKGDSMIGARIFDGDIVFIRSQPEVDNGQIAAIIIDGEATLKRVYYYPDKHKLVLNPENPIYEPIVYVGSELSAVRILGRAVAFQSIVR